MKINKYLIKQVLKKQSKLIRGLVFGILLGLASCVEDVQEKPLFKNEQILLTDIIRKDASLSITLQALDKANLSNTLNTYGPYTFFAPDNQAFGKYFKQIGVSGIEQISEGDLRKLLQYHILPKRLRATDFNQGTSADSTVNGDYYNFDLSGGIVNGTKINEKAIIYDTDIPSGNAILHKIDAVLDPPLSTLADYLVKNSSLSILKAGMERAGLMDTLATIRSINYRRPYTFRTPLKIKTRLTLFAETNDVMEAGGVTLQKINSMPIPELKQLMRYHLVPGHLNSNKIVPVDNFVGLGIPSPGRLDAINLETLNPENFINYDTKQAKRINQTVSIRDDKKNLILKNGVVHFIDKPLKIVDIGKVRRIPIVHELAKGRWYAFGAPVNNNSPRVFGPERASNQRPATLFVFMVADSPGDSLVTFIPGVQKGKYKITLSYKSGGNRNNVQPMLGGKATGLSKVDLRSGPAYQQNKIITNSYTFKTSGTKRIAFMSTNYGGRYEIPLDAVVLTPIQ